MSLTRTLSAGALVSPGVGRGLAAASVAAGVLSDAGGAGQAGRAGWRLVLDLVERIAAPEVGWTLRGPLQRTFIAIQPERTGGQGRPGRAERSEPRSGALDRRGAEATNRVAAGFRRERGVLRRVRGVW